VAHAKENLWATIKVRFHQAFTDTTEKVMAQQTIRDLRMKGDDLDTYISQFQSIAKKAGYNLDKEATLDIFQRGLPYKLVSNCIKFDHPITWNDWTQAACTHQQGYIFLKERVKGGEQ